MITTVTTTTTTTVTTVSAASLVLVAIITLLSLLISKEIIITQNSELAKRVSKALNIAIVPLLIVFFASASMQIVTLLK
jgi:hypothetical protein